MRGRLFYVSFSCEKTSRLSSDEEKNGLFQATEILFQKHLRNNTAIACHEMIRDNAFDMIEGLGAQRLIGAEPSDHEPLVKLVLIEGFCMFSAEELSELSTPLRKGRLLGLESVDYFSRRFRLIGELSAEKEQKLQKNAEIKKGQKKSNRLASQSKKANYWVEGEKKELWNKEGLFNASFFAWQKKLQQLWLSHLDEQILYPYWEQGCSSTRAICLKQALNLIDQGKPAPYLFSTTIATTHQITLGEWGLWDSSCCQSPLLYLFSDPKAAQKSLEDLFCLLGSFYAKLKIPYTWHFIKGDHFASSSVSRKSYHEASKKLSFLLKEQRPLERNLQCPPENLHQGPVLALCVEDSFGALWPMAQLQLITLSSDIQKHSRHQACPLETIALYPYCNPSRFIAHLLETAAPISPLAAFEHVRILVKEESALFWAYELAKRLKKMQLQVTCDDRSCDLRKKVWLAENASVPVIFVVGAKEAEKKGAAWRSAQGTKFIAEEQVESLIRSQIEQLK